MSTSRQITITITIISTAALLFDTACAVSDPARGRERAPIVNGTPATDSPTTVSIGDFCSGTLIAPTAVLTAAHCLEGTPVSDARVFFGDQLAGPGTWVDAASTAVHPSVDLGLVLLAEPGPVPPVPAYGGEDGALEVHVGEPVHIVGFGVTAETGDDFGIKREGMATLTGVEGSLMVASNVPQGTCYGDSGGPNYMTIGGAAYVVGVTSFGDAECGSGNDYSERTDTAIDWIRETVQGGGGDDACAADGICNAECAGYLDNDPDCAGCGGGDVCRADCPDLDLDCCAADGACNPACGDADSDCVDDGSGGDDDDDDGTGAGDDDDDGSGGGGCQATGRGAGGGAGLVLMALACAVLRRRRPVDTASR